jgi:transposase
MNMWFHDARRTHNQVLDFALSKNWHHNPDKFDEKMCRKQFVTAENTTDKRLLRTPTVIRKGAVIALSSDFKRHKTNLKKYDTYKTTEEKKLKIQKKTLLLQRYKMNPNNYKIAMVKHREKEERLISRRPKFNPKVKQKYLSKSTTDTIYVEKRSVKLLPVKITRGKERSCFALYSGNNKAWKPSNNMQGYNSSSKSKGDIVFSSVECSGKLPPDPFTSDVKFHYSQGEFYLVLTEKRPKHEKQTNVSADKMCAIDPGVRKLATVYSPEGIVETIGTNTGKVTDKIERRIVYHKNRLKEFEGSRDKFKLEFGWTKKTRRIWRLRYSRRHRAYLQAETKGKNVIKDTHYKLAHHLCQNYKCIFFPNTNSSRLAELRTMDKRTKRALSHLRWGSLRSRLSQTATLYSGVTIFTGTEAYSSKQCGFCGTLNDELGSSETFRCAGSCKFESDRDAHAARNICLRYIQ